MLLYTDIITKDEMLSDSYPIKEVGGAVYEVDCAMITPEEGEIDIGANPSAEEAEEALESGAVTVNNVVYSFRLHPTAFDRKSYITYLKGYFRDIKGKMKEAGKTEDEIKEFEKLAGAWAKDNLLPADKFKEWEFFTGESMNPEGMIALLNYREDGVTPYIVIWKHGVKEVKV